MLWADSAEEEPAPPQEGLCWAWVSEASSPPAEDQDCDCHHPAVGGGLRCLRLFHADTPAFLTYHVACVSFTPAACVLENFNERFFCGRQC